MALVFSLLQTLAHSGSQKVPPEHVRLVGNTHDDPNSLQFAIIDSQLPSNPLQVPIIDLQLPSNPLQNHYLCKDQNDAIAAQISRAAENWGFFQIKNHGIADSVIARVLAVSKAFFQLPIEEKKAYANEAQNINGYGSKIGYSADSEGKLEWGEDYYNAIWPPRIRDMSKWPIQLSDFTEVMDEYSRELSKLFEVLMKALSCDLGLETEKSLNESLGGERKALYMRMNYYPPCPQPDLVLGLAAQSDPNVLTILLHDQTPGLQIHKAGSWIDVECVPGALVANIADQMEILSDGRYKSIEHRSIVRTRIAQECQWPCFALHSIIWWSDAREN